MNAYLSITAAHLAMLPQWTPVVYDSEGEHRRGFVDHVRRAITDEGQCPNVGFDCPGLLIWLDLCDDLALAALAARVVRPRLPEPGTAWLANAWWCAGGLSAWDLVERAERMLDMTPIQIETLARLARVVMGPA